MKKFLRYNGLLVSVFITGAVVLALEVSALRILSPYYGNTIFVASSVLGVVLGALSLGYYIGGKLADKNPKDDIFFGIIIFGGLTVLALHVAKNISIETLSDSLSIVYGPLLASLLFFFIPSILLGMLSPFAIRLLSDRSEDGVGNVSGKVFFWSTLGSIVGSLLTGFVLIPNFSLSAILNGSAIALLLLGFLGVLSIRRDSRTLFYLAITVVVALGLLGLINAASDDDFALYKKSGLYEQLLVRDGVWNGQAARFFIQDRSSSGAMFLDSDELVFDYTKYYELYKLVNPDAKSALVLGGGIYSIPKAFLAENELIEVDVVEIEPDLLPIAKKYFRLEESPRLSTYFEDGRSFLRTSGKTYDVIFSDVYKSLYSVPTHFTTREFFKEIKSSLQPDGVFIANFIGDLSRTAPSFLLSEIRTFREIFPKSHFFAVQSPTISTPQNIIFVGTKEKDLDLSRADNLRYLKDLDDRVIDTDRFNLGRHIVLTDDFAPTDFLLTRLLKKAFGEAENLPSGEQMFSVIDELIEFGPRFLGSPGHERARKFIKTEMETFADKVHVQRWVHEMTNGNKIELKNIIGRFSPEKENRIILGTHYDSKRFANLDSRNKKEPVPGANDSASGVAALFEIARFLHLKNPKLDVGIDFVFFDAEEGETDFSGGVWRPLGSEYFAGHISEIYPAGLPEEALILDMVCDKNLTIYKEDTSSVSHPDGVRRLWELGQSIDKNAFPGSDRQRRLLIQDDHTALSKIGIPSVLVIDFDYPYFHTTKDTLDKCSAESLGTVVETINAYLMSS